jgi:hypothetical protein
MLAVAWPSCAWTASALAPWAINNDAHRPINESGTFPLTPDVDVERSRPATAIALSTDT